MSTIFNTAIVNAFTNVWLPSVDGGVAVVNGGNTAQGIVKYDDAMEMGQGLKTTKSGTVKVLKDSIGVIDEDGVLSVDGVRVFVTAVSVDAAGAITSASFTESQPVPEEML